MSAWNGNGCTQAPPEPFSTTFTFDWTKAPLSLNYRLHRMAEAKITKEIRSTMHALARRIPDLGRCRVELIWWVNDRRKRDEENIVPVLKALCDGLVDAEVVADDTPQFMKKEMPAIRFVQKRERASCFTFTIEEIR